MLSCTEVLQELGDYLEAGVADEARRAIEAHLAHCRTCEVLFDSTRKTVTLLTDTGSFELPPQVGERLLEKLRPALRAKMGK